MNTKALKQKILDLAIHGKLLPLEKVEKIRKEEPASVLLEKIRAEKQEKIAKGELKKDKNDSFIFVGDDKRHYEKFADGSVKDIEDEIPFDVPDGWSWCRLGEICEVSSAKRVLQQDWKTSGIPFYRAREIAQLSNNETVKDDLFITSELYNELKQKYGVPIAGDLMVSAVGTIGKVYIVKDTDCFYYKDASVICFSKKEKSIDSLYLKLCCESDFLQEQMYSQSNGTTVDTITINKAQNYLIPLPPIFEQQKIVHSIQDFFDHICILEQNKSDLQFLINAAKSKILDLAIHGKLVSQDPNDEPAEELLKRIATSDNRPYEKVELSEIDWTLPNNWCLCHFGDIATVINGKNQSKVENTNGKYPIYGSGGIMGRADDYICPENCTIIGRKGSINNPIFVEEKFWNVDTAFGLSPAEAVLPRFLFYFCEYFDFTTLDSSTTLPSLTKTNIQQIIFALPPIEEQKRILDKTNELFRKLDEIVLHLI